MDDSDIICLDSSQEEPPPEPRTPSVFSVAPPQLCQRWTQPTPQHNSLRVAKASSQWHYPQPIITSVKSLSPQKHIARLPNSYMSTSKLRVKDFAVTPNYATSQPPILNPSINPVTPFYRNSQNLSIQPIKQYPEIQIKEVKSLSPLKIKNNVKGVRPVWNVVSNVEMSSTKDKKVSGNPECITLSDDEGCEGSNMDTINDADLDREPIKSEVNCGLKDESKIPASPNDETLAQHLDHIKNDDSQSELLAQNLNNIKNDDSQSEVLAQNLNHIKNDDSQSEVIIGGTREKIDDAAPREEEAACSSRPTNHLKRKIKPIPVVEKSADDFLEEFIQACLKVDSSEDMTTIISKKVRKHYTKVHPSFKKSIAFINFLKNLLSKVVKDHSNVYVHISDLTCELKARKDFSEEEEGPKSKKKKTSEEKVEDVDYDDLEIKRNVMKIKKLNKALTKIQKTIQDLESREVDWDDDDNSTYIMLQRYKERAVKIFNKLCEITKESKTAGNLSKVHFSGTPFPEVDKCIQQFVNETRQFPDFVDICEVIRSSSEKNNLKLTDKEIQDHAEKAFKIIGKELQRQRIHGHTESLLALIEGGDDPADTDKELEEQLTKNQAHWQNINKVIDEFAEKAKNKKTSANQLDSKEDEEGIDDDNDCDDEDDEEESEEETSDQKDDDNLSNLSSASDGEDSNIDDGIDEGLDEDVKEEEILQEESKSDDKETEEPEAEKKSMDPTEGKTDNLE